MIILSKLALRSRTVTVMTLVLIAVPVVYMLFEESLPNLYFRVYALVAGRSR